MSATPGLTLKKIPLLLVWAYAGQIAYTPPATTPEYETNQPPASPMRWLANACDQFVNVTHMFGIWTTALCELALICAMHFPSTSSGRIVALFSTPAGAPTRIHSSDIFLLGWMLTVAGALVRVRCYRVLGRQFSRCRSAHDEKHRLVMHGPYGVVRHPAYTGAILVSFGELLVELGSGSWLREAGLLQSSAGWLLEQLWITQHLVMIALLVRRMWKEDEELRAEFGRQWVEWSKRTPLRLVSYVF
ncbi:hypothetical protein OBBRIDRAFT_746092 [Obba rivulosa]|uniref:Protein-S-isoprenylcysteine O-methyltransferase n=1 Tax=Obba rivulosa TaxID=1052685 RepID=A0A8E2DSW7_9APHY|nr:hypothetical protein OBBRIDRAFT_746092 [Obba rivulosa]